MAWLGARISVWQALDFAVPIAVITPALGTAPQVIAPFTVALPSLAFAATPYGRGLIIATLVALLIAAELERHMQTTS